jgi:2-keto-4-pentenoate hydratase
VGAQVERVTTKTAAGGGEPDRRGVTSLSAVGWEVSMTQSADGSQPQPSFCVLNAAQVMRPETPLQFDAGTTQTIAPVFVFHVARDIGGPTVRVDDVLGAVLVSAGLVLRNARSGSEAAPLAGLFAGGKQERCDFDLSLVGCLFEVGGALQATAAGAAVMGHPAEAVACLSRWLDGRGDLLHTGNLVCSPSLTGPLPLQVGEVTARFGRLGAVTVSVSGAESEGGR